ncbi:MAG: alpha/beta fold hydrolase [Archangium sp.]|nr:alpha/beta fold hydrolase [Archangium sp.]
MTSALHDAGFATAVLHPRGSGFSDGLRGHVDDFSLILTDNQRFLERLQARSPRVFLLGASAGGAFALELAAQSSPSAIAGLVLVNPAWKLRTTPGMTPTLGDYLAFAANAVFRPSALTVDMNSKPEGVEFEPDRLDGLALQATRSSSGTSACGTSCSRARRWIAAAPTCSSCRAHTTRSSTRPATTSCCRDPRQQTRRSTSHRREGTGQARRRRASTSSCSGCRRARRDGVSLLRTRAWPPPS